MKSLNPLFMEKSLQVNPKASTMAPELATITSRKKERRERSDKRKDIKFPVTIEQRQELRRLAKRLPQEDPKKNMVTISNTKLLEEALQKYEIFPEQFPPLVYEDSGQYMHVKPIKGSYEKVEQLAIEWNVSIRKASHRLLMNHIFRCEVDWNVK